MPGAKVIRLEPPPARAEAPLADERSTMLARLGPLARTLVALALRFVRMPPESVELTSRASASRTSETATKN